MASPKAKLKAPPERVDTKTRYFATKEFDVNNVSFELLALVYLLRFMISPVENKSGNPYTMPPVKFALQVVAAITGKSHEGYDYLEALDGLEDL